MILYLIDAMGYAFLPAKLIFTGNSLSQADEFFRPVADHFGH
jgi:hypothetical protein